MFITPNWFAYFALLVWPLIVLWLYQSRPIGRATLLSILGAQLLLPVGAAIDLSGLPALDKISIPNLAAFVGIILIARRVPRFPRGFGVRILIFMYIVGPFVTAALNTDPINMGGIILPGENQYDALSALFVQVVFFLPFLMGLQLLRTTEDHFEILRILTIAGLLYSVAMLVEFRLSPQLHNWVYGYHAHYFTQQIRGDGFRATVFMGHGLLVAFFTLTCTVAAVALWRARLRVTPISQLAVSVYLSGILLLCKSAAAIAYGAVLLPLVKLATPRLQIRAAVVLVSLSMVYPALRMADVFPSNFLTDVAASFSEDRAGSLKQRFDNERRLLDHAAERIVFGWGRWGRSRIYDPETGTDISVTDGRWVITLGVFGLVGFIAEFGLLAFAVVRAASALKFASDSRDRIFLPALALIVAIIAVDQLPNSSLSPWAWLLTGALVGRAEALVATAGKNSSPLISQNATVAGAKRRFGVRRP